MHCTSSRCRSRTSGPVIAPYGPGAGSRAAPPLSVVRRRGFHRSIGGFSELARRRCVVGPASRHLDKRRAENSILLGSKSSAPPVRRADHAGFRNESRDRWPVIRSEPLRSGGSFKLQTRGPRLWALPDRFSARRPRSSARARRKSLSAPREDLPASQKIDVASVLAIVTYGVGCRSFTCPIGRPFSRVRVEVEKWKAASQDIHPNSTSRLRAVARVQQIDVSAERGRAPRDILGTRR
jgi:hypothetical protein